MNSSFSSINEILTVQDPSYAPKDAKQFIWNGRTVYALYIPKQATTPNTHPDLLDKNNNDYLITHEICDSYDRVINGMSFGCNNFIGCCGKALISEQYHFDFSSRTFFYEKDNFIHKMAQNEEIVIMLLKSTFVDKNEQLTATSYTPSYVNYCIELLSSIYTKICNQLELIE